ncbi:10781_t:CDS:2 [Dentiscutata erythropus]|uniref:10781_t:CDS:1 n=1 Tax=Dentiscutata erythropus TaxID=1348616 RepID=A0A9N9GHF2_9GLOM|nr:10781_t:CDS:2 [Dentiscutata erythropus]
MSWLKFFIRDLLELDYAKAFLAIFSFDSEFTGALFATMKSFF